MRLAQVGVSSREMLMVRGRACRNHNSVRTFLSQRKVFQEHFSLRFAYVRDSLAWQVNIQQQLL
jgi:hypothetical protein